MARTFFVVVDLHEIKEFDVGIRAFAIASYEIPGLGLAVVGDGPARESLTALAGENVTFVDWQEEPARAMEAFDILLHPMPGEGFGRIYVEAMACGKPVVAVGEGGVTDIVVEGETGFLSPARDPRSLGAALVRLTKDRELRERLGRAGRARAGKLYAPLVIAAKLIEI